MDKNFIEGLRGILCSEAIFLKEPMNIHTSFNIGGLADVFLKIKTLDELKQVISLCKSFEYPFFIIGKGSNVLIPDEGISGVVMKLGGEFRNVVRSENRVTIGAGASMASVASYLANNELEGFEFAAGIPGLIGGAIYMNAGAYGGEIKDLVVSVDILIDGEVKTFTAESMHFSYRYSIVQDMQDAVILSADLYLKNGKKEEILNKIKDYSIRRKTKQPLEYPSAGSTFKRPETGFAASLIEEAGLKGYRIGGAEVSNKHSGFIINVDRATARDVKNLISHVQKTVEKKSGIRLIPEVKIL